MTMSTVFAKVDTSHKMHHENSITVTAQRTPKKDIDIPNATAIITKESLMYSGVDNVFDALGFITGATTLSYGSREIDYGGMASRVDLRGIHRGTLVLLNGVPINVNGKSSLDAIMIDNIHQVEVIKGANSVLYGPEAMGGVINIITKTGDNPKSSISTGIGNLGYKHTKYMYSDANVFVGYEHSIQGPVNRISPNRQQNNKRNNYYMALNDVDRRNVGLTIQANDKIQINVMRSIKKNSFAQIAYNTGTILDNLKKTHIYNYRDSKNNIDVGYDDINRGLKFTIYYHNRMLEAQESNGYDRILVAKNNTSYRAHNYGVDLQKIWNNKAKDTFLLGGISYEREGYYGLEKGVRAHRENIAFYNQYNIAMSAHITSSIGVRQEYIKDPVRNRYIFTPEVKSLYKVNKHNSWYLNIGKAFQMPTLSELEKTAKNVAILNRSGKMLKPEEGWNYEIGIKHITKQEKMTVSLYYMNFKNLFAWFHDVSLGRRDAVRINKGHFKNYGLEIEYEKFITKRLSFLGGLSLSNPQNYNEDIRKWEQTYPKVHMKTAIQYHWRKWQSTIAINWLADRLYNIEGRKNKNLIHLNALVSYKKNEHNQVILSLYNILNRRNVVTNGTYENYSFPFNWTISYEYTF